MKKVWIVAAFSGMHNANYRNRNRFQYLANRLQEEGFDVTLFTSDFTNGIGDDGKEGQMSPDMVVDYPYRVRLIHEPGYTKKVSLDRLLSHNKFGANFKADIRGLEKPDVVYAAYPTMRASYEAGRYAKKNRIPFIVDVQDTWPESIAVALDTEKLTVRAAMWPFTKFADRIYRMADLVFGVSETYARRADVKGTKCREFIPVYIGTDLEKFDAVDIGQFEMKKEEGEIWVTYVGSLSHSYDVATAVRAFAELKDRGGIRLNVVGSGPDEEKLILLAKELGVYGENVFFHGLVDYQKVVAFLKESDIALNALTGKSKGTITNKLGDYVSAGLPILNSCVEKEVTDLIEGRRLGINYTPGDAASLKDALLAMLGDREAMNEFGANSREFAEKQFDRKESYKVIVDKIRSI